MSQGRLARSILALTVGCLFVRHASAGNEANFVLYDHHTDEKGETGGMKEMGDMGGIDGMDAMHEMYGMEGLAGEAHGSLLVSQGRP